MSFSIKYYNDDKHIFYFNLFSEIVDYDDIKCLQCNGGTFLEKFKLLNLPKNLIELNCIFNGMSSLPKLPDVLQLLYCGGNKLTKLPKLPNSLIELYCRNNKLALLPELPNSLQFLDCSNNQFIKKQEYKYKYIKCF
jgi:Leucine-rich repeat (LRR) protein